MQPHVHDAFFKEMLSRPEHAASLLRQILPARIAARLDLASLTLCPGSFVDEALKERHSDLLFAVPLEGRSALIYVLFEHHSHESDEALRARAITALARLSLWCLRHAREPWELVDRLGEWLDLVREVRRAPHGVTALVRIMRYIFATNEPGKPEELVARLLAAVGEEGKEEIMTAADQLMERGREQGINARD